MLFGIKKLPVDFRYFRSFIFCHGAYSKTQNPQNFYSYCFLTCDFSQTWFINVSLNLVKYFVTFLKFSVISVISGISGDSRESTWPYRNFAECTTSENNNLWFQLSHALYNTRQHKNKQTRRRGVGVKNLPKFLSFLRHR